MKRIHIFQSITIAKQIITKTKLLPICLINIHQGLNTTENVIAKQIYFVLTIYHFLLSSYKIMTNKIDISHLIPQNNSTPKFCLGTKFHEMKNLINR